ncbi:hypothetical protein EZ428_16770 [Pedobacter frigiditerrae]|uniref:HTH luxR-type domain-containing protein n=1 Tax=Pedobacter frigiditerrae TaxID=2530452 RepID=A0A4R0MR32_9SPHI|nr:hypothetical protein [Pedobacter frigiditerrae]TCC89348.1 hypothetical protein EZ428_16770 [Pedobacter frigiditerrae]
MRLSLSLLLCVLFCGFKLKAQSKLIAPYIKAWEVADTSQTHQAEKTYSLLKKNRNVAGYHQIINEMYAYLKDNPDDRLWIRTTMFDVYGRIELGIWKSSELPKGGTLLTKCIKIASKLNDDQLMAELYAQYAELSPYASSYVLYNLKAIELQKKIGVSHFVYVANRYYNVSLGLYLNEDYKQSINYGLKFLSFTSEEKKGTDPNIHILQIDIIGASYFRLSNIDSSKYYYQKLLDTLIKKPHTETDNQQLWIAIAKGNIGRILALQNQEDKALPLIKEHLKTSLRLKSFNNAAIAENNLGTIYLKSKAYGNALNEFRNAYRYAITDNLLKEKVLASKGLADTFKATKETDSAFAYYALHQKYRDSLTENINSGKLSAINASIAFDDMQDHLHEANNTIRNQRLTRNFILIAIVLLTVIALLFYNRKMLQQKHLAETLARRQKLAEQEANQAKEQILSFTENIIEKEKLIVNLQKQLVDGNEQLNESLLRYTLVTDTEWEKFRLEFSKAYPSFLSSLQKMLPTINPAEERLATLLCLKLTTNQIANTLGISKDSVGRSKRRLKQRLSLGNTAVLEDFVCRLV